MKNIGGNKKFGINVVVSDIKIKLGELVRVGILIFLVFKVYSGMLTGWAVASGNGVDGLSYNQTLHDAIIQSNAGFFPSYVGQSVFKFFGTPSIRGPIYPLFAQILNTFTLEKLNSIQLQHLMLLITSLSGAILMYYFLIKLSPKLRWTALAMAFLYASCPGIVGLIYNLRSPHEFLPIMFLPIVGYGLIKSGLNQSKIAFLTTAMGLSLVFMSHPPIGFWTAVVCGLFYGSMYLYTIIKKTNESKKILSGIFFFSLAFLLLNSWHIISILTMKLSDMNYYGNWTADNTIRVLKAVMPWVFFPLEPPSILHGDIAYLQLGYALSFIFIFSVVFSIVLYSKIYSKCIVYNLLGNAFLLLIFLYPIGPTEVLWKILPQVVRDLSTWPQERFYPIIAMLITFASLFIFQALEEKSKKHYLRYSQYFFLIFLGYWSFNQAATFFVPEVAHVDPDSTVLDEKNPTFTQQYILQKNFSLMEGAYDPYIETTLLDQNKNIILEKSNKHYVENLCFQQKNNLQSTINPMVKLPLFSSEHTELFKLHHLPLNEELAICLQVHSSKSGEKYRFYAIANNSFYLRWININKAFSTQTVIIPLYLTSPQNLSIFLDNASSAINIAQYSIITYTHDELPIQIHSLFPYQATIKTDTKNNYLEIFKEYHPGYQATVDNHITPVLASPSGLVMIPLTDIGWHTVTLVYKGTLAMHISFWICLLSWIILVAWILYKSKAAKNLLAISAFLILTSMLFFTLTGNTPSYIAFYNGTQNPVLPKTVFAESGNETSDNLLHPSAQNKIWASVGGQSSLIRFTFSNPYVITKLKLAARQTVLNEFWKSYTINGYYQDKKVYSLEKEAENPIKNPIQLFTLKAKRVDTIEIIGHNPVDKLFDGSPAGPTNPGFSSVEFFTKE